MTLKFDRHYNKIVKEYTTAKSKRQESRYWKSQMFPKNDVRQVRMFNDKTASQRTKLGNQQYVGKFFSEKGPRGKNKSEKGYAEKSIAKGIGGHLKVDGVNPKKPGSKVNSKQGDMEVKYALPNGLMKIGATNKTDFDTIDPLYYDK